MWAENPRQKSRYFSKLQVFEYPRNSPTDERMLTYIVH